MGEEELASATKALINHDLVRQLVLEKERCRDGEIQREGVGNIRYSDVDIFLSEMYVICRHDQMRSEDGQREKNERRREG